MANVPKVLNGKIVLQVWLLDNSYKTLLIEPTATVHVSPHTAGFCPRCASAPAWMCARTPSLCAALNHPHPLMQDVCRSMADKIGFSDPEDDSLCFSLNECLDGVTSELAQRLRRFARPGG
jgi:hypothetical protein